MSLVDTILGPNKKSAQYAAARRLLVALGKPCPPESETVCMSIHFW